LHSARQPQFGADDALPVIQSSLEDDALSGVRSVDVQLRVQMRERSNGPAFLICQYQLLGDLCSIDHATLCEKRTVTAPRCANSARNTSDGCTGTILWTAPRRTPSPAFSFAPNDASLIT